MISSDLRMIARSNLAGNWLKSALENFATPREKNIRPFFNKVLAFSQKVQSRRNNNFYFINSICQNFSHFFCLLPEPWRQKKRSACSSRFMLCA